MNAGVVDTDVLSFLFKGHQFGYQYEADLAGRTLVISFMTLAELDRWAIHARWGEVRRKAPRALLRAFRRTSIQPHSLLEMGRGNSNGSNQWSENPVR